MGVSSLILSPIRNGDDSILKIENYGREIATIWEGT